MDFFEYVACDREFQHALTAYASARGSARRYWRRKIEWRVEDLHYEWARMGKGGAA